MIGFRRVAPLVLGALLVACEDDPTGPSVVELLAARNLEALGRSRIGAGDGFGANAARAAALALRAGVRPAHVSITVDGVTEQYWALGVEYAIGDDATDDAGLVAAFTIRRTMAWRGSPPERLISITVPGDTGTFTWPTTLELQPDAPFVFSPAVGIMFDRDDPAFHAVDGGGHSTRKSLGAECSLKSEPIARIMVPELAAPTCHRAAFFSRFNMRVVEGPVPGAVAVRARIVEMGGQDVPGIRLLYRPTCIVC